MAWKAVGLFWEKVLSLDGFWFGLIICHPFSVECGCICLVGFYEIFMVFDGFLGVFFPKWCCILSFLGLLYAVL